MSSSTAIRRFSALALAAAALAPALFGQWRDEAAKLIGREKAYAKAADYLRAGWSAIPEAEKPDAAALRAYCAAKLKDSQDETRWIVEYFDTYSTKDSGFAFLDLIAQSDVIGYLNGWRMKYPWISGISLVKGVGDQVIMPEGILPLVVEINNPAYYKFSESGVVLKAGEFVTGFNIIALDANALFLDSSRRLFLLEIKSEGLVLTKEISLSIDVSSTRPKPAVLPQSQAGLPLEYKLTLYIDGKPVLTSQKTVRSVSLKMDIKPSNNTMAFRPDYMLNRDKPNPFNSVDIVKAVSVLYGLLKDLFSKKNKKGVEPPKIETVTDLTLNFNTRDRDGVESVTKVVLKLTARNLPFRQVS